MSESKPSIKDRIATPSGRLRLLNASIASVVAVFFLAHSALGSASLGISGLVNDVPWLVWLMLGVVVAHVIASAIATASMLRDKERPPSSRKKRHFVLKWVTGTALACAIAMHVLNLDAALVLRVTLFMIVAVALAWHVGIAAKSLARDLGISRRTRDILRTAYVTIVLMLVLGMLALVLFG